jgi:hypothetical protein
MNEFLRASDSLHARLCQLGYTLRADVRRAEKPRPFM